MSLEMNREKIAEVFGKKDTKGGKKKGISLLKKAFANSAIGVKLGTVLAAMALASSLSASSLQVEDSQQNPVTYEQQEQNNMEFSFDEEVEEAEETDVLEDDELLLADRMNFKNFGMTNNMPTIEETRAELAEELGATYSGPVFETENAGESQFWVSEQDYQMAEEAGIADAPVGTETTKVEGNYYVAPDGSVWTSEQDYLNSVSNSNDGGSVSTEGNYYVDENGVVWNSKEDADAYANSQNGTVVTPVEGEVVEQGDGYRDPEGNYWESEQDYLDYIKSLSTLSTDVTKGEKENNVEFYQAEDGSVWASEEDYLNYLQSLTQDASTMAVHSEEESVEVIDINNYFEDPEGNFWNSEEEYLEYINSTLSDENNSLSEVPGENESVVKESDIVQEPTDTVYFDENGNAWSSEQEYLDYIKNLNSESQEEKIVDVQLDEYGGYVDPTSGYYIVDGSFYASQQDYLAILALENGNEQAGKTMN